MLPPLSGGLAEGVELRFTTTARKISLDISLCPPCHVSLGGYHTAQGISAAVLAYFNRIRAKYHMRRVHLAFNTLFQTIGVVGYAKYDKHKTAKPNLWRPGLPDRR